MIFNQQTLEPIIRQAMQDRAPTMYQELMRSQALSMAVETRAKAAIETYSLLVERAKDEILSSQMGYQESVQAQNQAMLAAREAAIAEATDFPTEESPPAPMAA